MTENEMMITVLEAEKDNVKRQLKDRIKSIQNTLKSLECKLETDESFDESEGLQGDGRHIDLCLTKLAMYDKTIARLKK